MNKTSTARRLQVETLENRELMAGNVNVSMSNGNLFITGDANPNHVQVRQSSPGVYSISGVMLGGSATKINGYNGVTASGVTGNVSVSLGGGSDQLDFGTGDARQINVPGTLTIDMGTGNDWTYVRDVKTGGNLTVYTGTGQDRTHINNANVGNNLFVLDPSAVNSGDSDLTTVLTSRVKGQMQFMSRGGADSVEIQSSTCDSVYADLGAGNDFFKMLYTKPRAHTVIGGTGNDTFFVPDYLGTRFNNQSGFETVRR